MGEILKMNVEETEVNFEEMATFVADSFIEAMQENGFETFGDMCDCYDWDTQEIREEIETCVDETGGYCYDSMVTEPNMSCEMPYREFKKMVMSKLK